MVPQTVSVGSIQRTLPPFPTSSTAQPNDVTGPVTWSNRNPTLCFLLLFQSYPVIQTSHFRTLHPQEIMNMSTDQNEKRMLGGYKASVSSSGAFESC